MSDRQTIEPALDSVQSKQSPVYYIQGPPGSGKTQALAREAVRLILKEKVTSDHIRVIVQQASDIEVLENTLTEEASLAGHAIPPVTVQTWQTFLLKLIRLYADKVPLPTAGEGKTLPHHVQKVNRHQALLILQTQVSEKVKAGLLPVGFDRSDSFISDLYQWILGEYYHLTDLQNTVSMPSQYLDVFQDLQSAFIGRIHQEGLLTSYDITRMGHQLIEDLSGDGERNLLEVTLNDIQAIFVDDCHLMDEDDVRALLLLSRQKQLTLASSSVYPAVVTSASNVPVTHDMLSSVHRGNEPVLWWLSEWQKKTTETQFWEIHESSHEQTLKSLSEHVSFIEAVDDIEEAEQIAESLIRHHSKGVPWTEIAIVVPSSQMKTTVTDMLAARKIPVAGECDVLEPAASVIQHFIIDAFRVLAFLLENPDLPVGSLLQADVKMPKDKTNSDEPEKFTSHRMTSSYFKRMLSVFSSADIDGLAILKKWFGLTKKILREQTTEVSEPVLSKQLWQLLSETDFFAMERYNPDQNMAVLALSGFNRQLATLEESGVDSVSVLSYVNRHFAEIWPSPSIDYSSNVSSLSQMESAQGVRVVQVNLKSPQPLYLNQPEVLVLAGMTEGLYPLALSELDDEVLADRHLCQQMRYFISLLTQSRRYVLLSSSGLKNGRPVLPSVFFRELKLEYEMLLNLDSDTGASLGAITAKPPERLYEAENKWSALPDDITQSSIYLEESGNTSKKLVLSPSSVESYMRCPRQFYYGHVLRLPKETSEAANVGLLVHRLMEIYNVTIAGQDKLPVDAHAGALKDIAKRWFELASGVDGLAGFDETDSALIAQLDEAQLSVDYFKKLLSMDAVSLETLRLKMINTIDDMDHRGYFKQYGECSVNAEEKLTDFSVEGIEHVQFKGMLDALINIKDDDWVLMDYKHYGASKFSSIKNNQSNFEKFMFSLIEADAVDHESRFALRLNSTYPAGYQLILYYLGKQNDSDFNGEIKQLCLQVVRPTLEKNAALGSVGLTIDVDELKKALPDIISDLRQYIAEPIHQANCFDKNPGDACKYCSFIDVCDVGSQDDVLQGGGAND